MFKTKTQFLTLLVMLLTTLSVANAEARIGFVNIARVLKEAPQADAARKKLENEFAPRDKKIVGMQKKLKKLEEELARDAGSMSDEVRKKKERQIILEKREIKRTREEFNEDLNIRRNDELNKLQKLVYDTIVSLAKDEKYDLIFGDNVLYAGEQVDLTGQVLKRLKARFEATSTATRN